MKSFFLLSIFFHGVILSLLFHWKISLVEPPWPRSVIVVSLIALKEEIPIAIGPRPQLLKDNKPPMKEVFPKREIQKAREAPPVLSSLSSPVEAEKREAQSTPLATLQWPEPEPLGKSQAKSPEGRPQEPEEKMPRSEEGPARGSDGEIRVGDGLNLKASGSPGGLPGESAAVVASHGLGIFPGGRHGPGESKGQGLGEGGPNPGQQSKAQGTSAIEDETLLLILRKIEAAKRYPPIARRMGIEGKTVVRFKVRPNGSIETAEIVESSGFAILDQASLDTVRRAAPLPYREGWLKVGITFKML